VAATNLAIRFERLRSGPRSPCHPNPPAWASRLCAAAEPIGRGRIDDTDYPITAYVFSPGEVRLGEFGGSFSSYRDSLAGSRPGRNEAFLTTDIRTSDGNPLTFACAAQRDSTHWCSASYLWANGAHVNYVFRSPPDQIADRGRNVDAALRDFMERLRTAR
jgi:hypothetical protein